MPAFKNIGSADQSKITHNHAQTFLSQKMSQNGSNCPNYLMNVKKNCHKKIQHIFRCPGIFVRIF